MRRYQFNEYSEETSNLVVEMTEEEIIKDYWPVWSKKMEQKFGPGHELITKENCIEDWVIVNWAWEVK